MSGLQSALLLLGIFGVPLLLLAAGHRFRRLSRRMRGAFWGGVAGYAIGVIIWAIAAIAPAQMWSSGNVRFLAVVLALPLSGGAGFAFGALVGNHPRRRRHQHRKEKRAASPARDCHSVESGTGASQNRC